MRQLGGGCHPSGSCRYHDPLWRLWWCSESTTLLRGRLQWCRLHAQALKLALVASTAALLELVVTEPLCEMIVFQEAQM